jgi:hypothetical protein
MDWLEGLLLAAAFWLAQLFCGVLMGGWAWVYG